jgi:peptide subunit release factor 1 (eRF1)
MLHIDLPTRGEIEKLSEQRTYPCVSIYMRTHPITQQADTDRLELARLFRETLDQMKEADTDKRAIWPIEEAVQDLVDDPDFWDTQANSLAVLVTPQSMRTYRLPNQLANLAEVSDRFHLKPLLRAVTFPHNAYVLAHAVGGVRLIEMTANLPAREVKVPGLPKDLNDAMGKASRAASQGAVRSGRHISEGDFFQRYARTVDAALRPFLQGHERPLIIAGPEPHCHIFRSISSYPNTAQQVIEGSFDQTPEHEIAEKAREVLDGIYADEIAKLHERFAARASDNRAVSDVSDAARAATFGAVDTLIFDMDDVVHGTVDDTDGKVTFAKEASAHTYGVVDEIAARALRTGARLLACRKEDIPGGGSLAAMLRYPV